MRRLFFAKPGHTLGLQEKEVFGQAQNYDPHIRLMRSLSRT